MEGCPPATPEGKLLWARGTSEQALPPSPGRFSPAPETICYKISRALIRRKTGQTAEAPAGQDQTAAALRACVALRRDCTGL
ncbi:hypothetical protein Y1Q_0012361 [Alligator mississippiensis]|uniref:Uncharacterized protein n=1 Tax=Alligator mississippiensis TaxID=8496 RepID=A0A151M5B7_ALLMI|nr:hypothetical protein Y1Q_0012361 [Alligator mississippiensis]